MDSVVSSEASGASSQGNEHTTGGEQAPSNAEYQEMLKSLGGEVESLKSERDSMAKVMKGTENEVARIKRAVVGEPEHKRSPDDEDGDFANMFLDAALEDQKNGGKGLPLTTKLAMEMVEMRKANRQLSDQIKKLTEGHGKLTDPEIQYDQQAFGAMDLQVQNTLQSVYGEIQPHMFRAVTSAMADEIKNLKATKPQVWAEIRRNPEYQRRMSLHFVEKMVPPKARQIMTDEKERNTPMTRKELKQAMGEANQIANPEKRAQVKEMIRQKLLEDMYSNKR